MSIPEQLEVSVEGAEIGTQITAGDLTLPAGVILISDAESLLVNVVETPSEDDLEAEGEGTEPVAETGEAETKEEAGSDSES